MSEEEWERRTQQMRQTVAPVTGQALALEQAIDAYLDDLPALP